MIDSFQEGVPLSHAIGTGTLGQPPRTRPSLKSLASRVLEPARERVPLSHAQGTGAVGQAVTGPARARGQRSSAWSGDDWLAFFEERAGIAEHDGGLSRSDAERRAFECCIMNWLWQHPPSASGPERCAHCGQPLGEPGRDGVPFLTGDGGHIWLHDGCHGEWTTQRRGEAVTALAQLGLTPRYKAEV